MKTRAEQLPVELWLTIFSYFDVRELFYVFSNLNNYFDELLASNHLSFYVQLEFRKNNYDFKFHWSNSILHRLICLQSSAVYQPGDLPQFLQSYSKELIRLQSLILQSPIQEIPSICIALENLHSLHYLSLTCVPTQNLFEAILAVPVLCVCRFKFWRPISNINYHSGTNSNVQVLHIKMLEDPDHSIINLLLSHMPKLRYLDIKTFDSVPLFNQQLFILKHLEILKFIWNSRQNRSDYSANCLKVIPCLKRLYLTVYYYKLNELMDNSLIHFLKVILEKLKSIIIFIQCRQVMKIVDIDIQRQIGDYSQQLLNQLNTQSNAVFEIKLIENNSYEHTIKINSLKL